MFQTAIVAGRHRLNSDFSFSFINKLFSTSKESPLYPRHTTDHYIAFIAISIWSEVLQNFHFSILQARTSFRTRAGSPFTHIDPSFLGFSVTETVPSTSKRWANALYTVFTIGIQNVCTSDFCASMCCARFCTALMASGSVGSICSSSTIALKKLASIPISVVERYPDIDVLDLKRGTQYWSRP